MLGTQNAVLPRFALIMSVQSNFAARNFTSEDSVVNARNVPNMSKLFFFTQQKLDGKPVHKRYQTLVNVLFFDRNVFTFFIAFQKCRMAQRRFLFCCRKYLSSLDDKEATQPHNVLLAT